MTTRPPPTCTTGMEIPKKFRMCVPIKKDATSKKKLFTATWRAKARRAAAGEWRVNERKMGLPPSGFTMGKSALRISKMLLPASSNEFRRLGKYSREAAERRIVEFFGSKREMPVSLQSAPGASCESAAGHDRRR